MPVTSKKSLHTGVQAVIYMVFQELQLTMSNVPSLSVLVDRVGAGPCESTSSQIAGMQGS